MTTATERLRTQQDLADDDSDAVVEAIRSALQEVHTTTVGIVQSFNVLKQTAKVQPAIKRVLVNGQALTIRVCEDVPVLFPGGALTFDISQGDEGLLVFAERCIDRWWSNGGVQEPDELRFHDLSDGFLLVGVQSLANLLTSIGDGTELRLRSGACRVAIKPDGRVLLGSITPDGMELQAPINGVVLGGGIEPVTKMTYFALGAASSSVYAKK